MFDSLLCGHERRTDVYGDQTVEVLDGELVHRRQNADSGIVNKHVEPAEVCGRLDDGVPHGLNVGAVGADGERRLSCARDLLDDLLRPIRRRNIGDGHSHTVSGETFGDGRSNTARAAGDEGHSRGLCCTHSLFSLSSSIEWAAHWRILNCMVLRT